MTDLYALIRTYANLREKRPECRLILIWGKKSLNSREAFFGAPPACGGRRA